MSVKAKKRLIIILSSLLILISVSFIGLNIYIDSILNKMDQTDEFDGKDVNAHELDGDIDNIAILGVDATGGDGARTDVIKIISLDFDNDNIKISSIQRDNLVYQPMQERHEKLNHAYMRDGVQGTLSALNYSLDLNITKYVKFDFDSVPKIVDILGGVDIQLTQAEANECGANGAGVQRLNGDQALAYSRIRDVDSDYGRMQRQNNVINAILAGVKNNSPFELIDIVNQVMPYIETNVTNGKIKSYATSLISFDLGETKEIQFPSEGYNSILTSLSLYGYGPHYVLKDFEKEVKILHESIYGGTYTVSKNVTKVDQETKKMAGY